MTTVGAAEMGEAKQWKLGFTTRNPNLQFIELDTEQSVFDASYIPDGVRSRILREHNALSGIANVEALGDFIAASLNLRGGHAEGLLILPDFWLDALAALYAPQASEAKPL